MQRQKLTVVPNKQPKNKEKHPQHLKKHPQHKERPWRTGFNNTAA